MHTPNPPFWPGPALFGIGITLAGSIYGLALWQYILLGAATFCGMMFVEIHTTFSPTRDVALRDGKRKYHADNLPRGRVGVSNL